MSKEVNFRDVASLIKAKVNNLDNYELFLTSTLQSLETYWYPDDDKCGEKQYVWFTKKEYILIEYLNLEKGGSGWFYNEYEKSLKKICKEFDIKINFNLPKIVEDSCEIQDEWGNLLEDIFKIRISFYKKDFLFAFLLLSSFMDFTSWCSSKNQPEAFLNSRSLGLFFTISHLSEEDRNKYVVMGESYINLEKLFKDLSVLKEGLNEFIIVGSSIEDMEYKSCIMFHFENAYTEPYEFFKLEEKRISEYLQLIDEKK